MAFRKLLQLFTSTTAKHQNLSALHNKRKTLIQSQIRDTLEQFQREDFSTIRARLAFVLRFFLPEILLRKAWKYVQMVAGPVVSTGTPSVSVGWVTDSVSMPVRFRRVGMVMKMQMMKSGSVVGLRFLPGGGTAEDPWQRPVYGATGDYQEKEIKLGDRGNRVGGTLMLPRGGNRVPCVILLGGSGPCDRDSTLHAAKPFKDIALGLAELGVGSVRFDKVTLTHGGKIGKKTDFTLTDEYFEHATNAISLAARHPRIRSDAVFVAGHSLGAVVTPKLCTSLSAVKGFILMAPPAQRMYWSAIRQLEYLSALEPDSSDKVEDKGLEDLRQAAELADSPNLSTSTPADILPFGIGPHYWLNYRTFNPIAKTLDARKPVLILQGEKDYQVTMQDDYSAWQSTLKGANNVEMRSYESLDHLFMRCDGMSRPQDYEAPRNVEHAVIQDIARWVHKHESCGVQP